MKQSRKTKPKTERALTACVWGGVILLSVFSLQSGGEIPGLITVLAALALAYTIARNCFSDIHLEKLLFFTVGIYFTIVSLLGFSFMLIGLDLSVKNFFVLSLTLLLIALYYTKDRQPCSVKIDYRRLLLIGGSFLAAFLLYLWPSLPSFTSPCTFGFDCTLHMEYMSTIYSTGVAVPPVPDWRYYPNGLHINGALLAHALEPDMPGYSSFAYSFNALIAAMTVGILAGMLYDRLKNKLYVLVFLLAILTTVYPASALIGFGFWAGSFGIYYIVMFAWMLSEYAEKPDNRMLGLLALTAVGSIIAYQILASLTLVLSFILASMTLMKAPLADKTKKTVAFIIILGLFYGVYTIEGYSRYLSYSDEPADTYQYLAGRLPEGIVLNKPALDVKMNGTTFQIISHGLHVEEVFSQQGLNPTQLLSKGLDTERFRSYIKIGRENIKGPSGNAIYFDIKYFGLLTVLLMAAGMLYSYSKRDYTLVFIEASVIHLYLFSLGLKMGEVNAYYYSKMMYFFIYPVTMYAIVGVEELLSRLSPIKKTTLAYAVIMVLMTAYSLNLIDKDQVGITIGERSDLYEEGRFWPLLEYNRFLRYWDMAYGVKRDQYGLAGWLQMSNRTLPFITTAAGGKHSTLSGVWNAALDFSHQLGHSGSDGSWESKAGGFGYMIDGMYMEIPAGSYTVSFRIKIDDNKITDKSKVVTIEVAKNQGIPVVVRDLYIKDFAESNAYQDFTLNLDARETIHDAEFRVHYAGSPAKVSIQQITLNPR